MKHVSMNWVFPFDSIVTYVSGEHSNHARGTAVRKYHAPLLICWNVRFVPILKRGINHLNPIYLIVHKRIKNLKII